VRLLIAMGLGWSLLLPTSCGSSTVATVPTGEHLGTSAQLVEVDYPPPPAQVEEVGPPPDPACRWVDGYWDWVGRRWEWIRGGWVKPEAGCYYAPRIVMVWLASDRGGTLYYGKPRWYQATPESSEQPAASCEDPPPCAAGTGR
jgi:hypothetical protein